MNKIRQYRTWNTPAMIELINGEIILRPFELEDAEQHLAVDDEENSKWLSGGVSTIETVRNWIRKNQRAWENDDSLFNFAIFDVMTNKLIGMVEANADPNAVEGLQEGEINISYQIYPFARRKGYATKAVNVLADFLKQKGFRIALIRVHHLNTNSLGVPIRCGFTRKGQSMTHKGERFIHFVKQLHETHS